MKTLGNVFILGDSYSTFKGYIPEGYSIYYGTGEHDFTGVIRVEDTWWHRLIEATSSHLVMNNSWSGAAVSHTGYGGFDPVSSFVTRAKEFVKDGKCGGEKIDTILIFGGTNDSWGDFPIGEIMYEGRKYEDMTACLPAYCEMLDYLTNEAPDTRIINMINSCIKDEIKDGIEEVSRHYGTEVIRLGELELENGHPTYNGMITITDQMLDYLSE